MLRWSLIALLLSLNIIAKANTNLQSNSQKGVESVSIAATQLLSNLYANKANLILFQTSEELRKNRFDDAFKSMNILCTISKIEFISFYTKKSELWGEWGIQCAENKAFLFFVTNDSKRSLNFLDCKICLQNKFSDCPDWCSKNIPQSEKNTPPESYGSEPELDSLPESIENIPNQNITLEHTYHNTAKRFTINYPLDLEVSESSNAPSFSLPGKPWRIMIDAINAKEQPSITQEKGFMSRISKDIKFLNDGPLIIKASDNSNLKADYIIAVYSRNGIWFEILNIRVERPTAPKYLRFIYVSPINQEKNSLPIVKAMLKTWSIDP